jgi:hypothetical protein
MVGWHHFAQPPASDRTPDTDPGLKVECTRCKKSKVIKYGNTPIGGGPTVGMGPGGGG